MGGPFFVAQGFKGVHAEAAEKQERRGGVALSRRLNCQSVAAPKAAVGMAGGFAAGAASLRLQFLLCGLCVNPLDL